MPVNGSPAFLEVYCTLVETETPSSTKYANSGPALIVIVE